MTTWHLITGEYPPSIGGVGDYTRILASELGRRGHAVHVWCPAIPSRSEDRSMQVHGLPDAFGPGSRRALQPVCGDSAAIVLLQYVPGAFGAGGMNLPFCRWLRHAGNGADLRIMFHEPYFYFSWNPAGNVRAMVQRLMARALVDAGRIIYLSTETWRRFLPPSERTLVLPVPSAIPRLTGGGAAMPFRALVGTDPRGQMVGHFGTYGDHVARELEPVVARVLGTRPSAHFLCIGRHGERFAAALRNRHMRLADRIHHSGALPAADVAAAIRACDVMVQPYPDGITTRRTSVMASLTNAVATVSTDGELTEPVWRDSGAAALAPASDPRAIATTVLGLLDDTGAREAVAEAGRRAYDTYFAIEKSVDALLGT